MERIIVIAVIIILALYFIGKNTPGNKVKNDPEVWEILRFFKAAQSMPRQSNNIHLALVINAKSNEPLQCQYYDIDETKQSIVNRSAGMYNRSVLEKLLKDKAFPQCTFVDLVGEVVPYGYILTYTSRAAYPNLLDQYTTVIAKECQKCGMSLVEEHCDSSHLQIFLQNDIGDKK